MFYSHNQVPSILPPGAGRVVFQFWRPWDSVRTLVFWSARFRANHLESLSHPERARHASAETAGGHVHGG